MLTDVVQRWRDRRGVYRPAGEVIDTRLYEVAPIPDDDTARAFVEQHHYSSSYPAARERFGLYWGGLLVGVAVFSQPMQEKVLDALPCDHKESVELGRLILLDRVPANGESWMVTRCFELLWKDGYRGVVSHSDPERRVDVAGRVVLPGHAGTIYQALNAVYTGRTKPRTLHLLPDGTVLSDRAMSKIRAQERGHEYAEALLVQAGAKPRRDDDPRAWLTAWLPRITRTMRHRGNFRYLFGLDRRVRRHLPASLPYPKLDLLGAIS